MLGILVLSSASVNAAQPDHAEGPYVGGSLGRSSFSAMNLGVPTSASDEVALSGKVYAGYRFTEHVGVEAGYARLGSVSETATVGAGSVEQSARGRSLYTAVTGRMPLTQAVALTGKAGISLGKVSGTNLLPAPADMLGSKRSFMYSLGAEYQMSPQVALTADFDHFGRLSEKVRANMLSVGMRYSF